jgi:hypothetical protein
MQNISGTQAMLQPDGIQKIPRLIKHRGILAFAQLFSLFPCLPTASGCHFFLGAETSELPVFWAALSQAKQA